MRPFGACVLVGGALVACGNRTDLIGGFGAPPEAGAAQASAVDGAASNDRADATFFPIPTEDNCPPGYSAVAYWHPDGSQLFCTDGSAVPPQEMGGADDVYDPANATYNPGGCAAGCLCYSASECPPGCLVNPRGFCANP